MITTESTVSIARPAEEVFDFISDLRNDPRWHTDILDAQLRGAGPVGQGSTFDVKFKPFMGRSQGTVTIAEIDRPSRITLRGKMGKLEPTIVLSIEAAGEGSRVSRRVEMQPPGLMRLMTPMMKPMFGKRNAGFVANLKRVLEV